jgi:DNA-binding XRE family transcriptional regulator
MQQLPNLRTIRDRADLSRQKLAEQVGCSQSTIQDLETQGSPRDPAISLVRAIAEALNCPIDSLFLESNTRFQVSQDGNA